MAESIYSGRVRTRGCALVIKNRKLLLIQQQLPTRKSPVWLPPGGEVELGETVKDAAVRETFEETGIRIKPTRLVVVHEFIEPPFHAVELYYLSEFIGGSLKIGTDPELSADEQQILECEFIDIESISGMPVFPSFIQEIDRNWVNGEREVLHFTSEK